MERLGRFFSIFLNSFTWQTLILCVVNICFGNSGEFNAYSVIQCAAVSVIIAVCLLITDIITSYIFKIKLSLTATLLISIAEVFLIVMLVGGKLFNWFDFVLTDLLIAIGVILAVFFIVFAAQVFRMKADSQLINKILKERNGNEKGDNN